MKKTEAYGNLSMSAYTVEHTSLQAPLHIDVESQIRVHRLPLLARAATFLFQKYLYFCWQCTTWALQYIAPNLSAGGHLLCSVHLQDNLHKESKRLPSEFQISIKELSSINFNYSLHSNVHRYETGLLVFHSIQTFRFHYYSRLKINNARFMKQNVPLHLKYLWNSLKKKISACILLWNLKCKRLDMHEGAWQAAKLPQPNHPHACPSLGPEGPGRGNQPATFLAQLITETSPLLTLPLISNLSIAELLDFLFLPDITFHGNSVFC